MSNREPVIHDFTQRGWGHNFENYGEQSDGTHRWATWSTPIVREGDFILYETVYGTAKGEVVKSEPPAFDVDDMRWINFNVVARYDKQGNELEVTYLGELRTK